QEDAGDVSWRFSVFAVGRAAGANADAGRIRRGRPLAEPARAVGGGVEVAELLARVVRQVANVTGRAGARFAERSCALGQAARRAVGTDDRAHEPHAEVFAAGITLEQVARHHGAAHRNGSRRCVEGVVGDRLRGAVGVRRAIFEAAAAIGTADGGA